MNNVLVRGGSGFRGGHLVQALHDTYPNINITVVDDLRTPGNYIVDSNRVSYYYKSIQDPEVVGTLKARKSFDTIFHLANTPRVRRAIEFPVETIDNNVTSTSAVCDIALEHSSHVYFAQSSSVQYEDQGTLDNAYTLSKSFCDQMLDMFTYQYGLHVTKMYYYSVYGPREADYGPYSTVVRRFKQRVLEREPLEIYGNGTKARDFTHVADVVSNMMLMMEDPRVINGEISSVHFGRGKPRTIQEIADAFNHPQLYKFDLPGEAQITECQHPYGEYVYDVLEYIKEWVGKQD